MSGLGPNQVMCNCTEESSRKCGIGRFRNICITEGGCSADIGLRSTKDADRPNQVFGLSLVLFGQIKVSTIAIPVLFLLYIHTNVSSCIIPRYLILIFIFE